MLSFGRGRLIAILSHAALVQLITFAVRPTLSYAVLEAGGSAAVLGMIVAAFAGPALLLALPVGQTIDRIGERPILVLGSLLLLASCALAVFSQDSVSWLVVATVILGCGHLLSVVGDQAMMSNTPSKRSLDSRFGLYAFAASLGQTFGPLLLMLPGGSNSVPPIGAVFIACAVFSAILVVLSILLSSSQRSDSHVKGSMGHKTLQLLKQKGVPQALVASSIVLASIDLFVAYVPALGHDRNFSVEIISIMLVARSLMSMVSRLFLTQLISFFGRRRLLVGTVAISAVMLGGMFLPLPAVWFVVISCIYGFAIGTCQPITMAWVTELAPPGTRGLAMSLRVASNRVGQIALPAVLGFFAVAAGAGGVLALTGVALLGSAWSGMSVQNGQYGSEERTEE